MNYPERIPQSAQANLETFNFSFSLASTVRDQVEQEHSAVFDRIENILNSEKFFIAGVPVLRSIFALNPTKNDLKKLAKASVRLSELVEQYAELEGKLNLIKTVNENPHWFARTFGDFSKELDQDLDNLFNEIPD